MTVLRHGILVVGSLTVVILLVVLGTRIHSPNPTTDMDAVATTATTTTTTITRGHAVPSLLHQQPPQPQPQPQHHALEHCRPEQGGGLCPALNTCCPLVSKRTTRTQRRMGSSHHDTNNDTQFVNRGAMPSLSPSLSSSSGCVPSDLGARTATCCTDNAAGTACGVGYTCRRRHRPSWPPATTTSNSNNRTAIPRPEPWAKEDDHDHDNDDHWYDCQASPSVTDPLVQTLPRYHLCTVHPDQLQTVHGFPVTAPVVGDPQRHVLFPLQGGSAQWAYYSSHGDLLQLSQQQEQEELDTTIRLAIVVIHGAGRNADDYFCSILGAVQRQYPHASSSVLVVAPWFLQVGDDDENDDDDTKRYHPSSRFLHWSNQSASGTWRYGANAIYSKYGSISSYDCMDALVRFFQSSLPHVKRFVVIGHSSGGQFVQRWSLLTSQWPSSSLPSNNNNNHLSMHAIVANPSSYAYLTPERWHKGQWIIPPLNSSCHNHYNQWQWGLELPSEPTSPYRVPYVERTLQDCRFNSTWLAHRFAQRRVSYLIGSQDKCNVSSSSSTTASSSSSSIAQPQPQQQPWCQSHGLETSCADEWQGPTRWDRHHRYYQSLLRRQPSIDFTRHHESVTVPQVGHDHSLMFHSPQGMQQLFFPES